MAKINLRPWRAEERERRQKEYVAVLMAVAGVALGIWFLISSAYQSAIDGQQYRNKYVEKQSKALDTKIKEISDLRNKRTQLLDRMKLIQDLQGNRPVIVRVFDEMTRVMPEEVYFEVVKVEGTKFTINGHASSNDQVSQLMRNFEKSPWFTTPNLLGVKANRGGYNQFDMVVIQTRPTSEEVK